jgi:hypothetical protein
MSVIRRALAGLVNVPFRFIVIDAETPHQRLLAL